MPSRGRVALGQASVAVPVGERSGLRVGRADLDAHFEMLRQFDLARVTFVSAAVDPGHDALVLLGFAPATSVRPERLAPHVEKLAQRERAERRRFDVDDAVGRVRVDPVEARAIKGRPMSSGTVTALP